MAEREDITNIYHAVGLMMMARAEQEVAEQKKAVAELKIDTLSAAELQALKTETEEETEELRMRLSILNAIWLAADKALKDMKVKAHDSCENGGK